MFIMKFSLKENINIIKIKHKKGLPIADNITESNTKERH